jgi:hypothetical protein
MLAHGQTMTWGAHVGRSMQSVRGNWLQRFRHWLTGRSVGSMEASSMAVYGDWDGRREQFRPLRVQSAFEHEAGRDGQSWRITLHSATLEM